METIDMSGKWDVATETGTLGTIQVIIPRIGSYVEYKGISYEILSTHTYQENSGEETIWLPKVQINTICDLMEITDECEDAGKPTIKVKADELTVI